MNPFSVENGRIRYLNRKPVRQGEFVLYWMQQSQRAEENHALEYAVEFANARSLPVLVVFLLFSDYPEANARHYQFMLEGLLDTRDALKIRGIQLAVLKADSRNFHVDPEEKAAAVITDRGYLRHQIAWRSHFAEKAECPVIQIESDAVVPVETASNKAEYAARFIRPKIHRHMSRWIKPVKQIPASKSSLHLKTGGMQLNDKDFILKELNADRSVGPVSRFFKGGTNEAKSRFDDFLSNLLSRYPENSNQPQIDGTSHMSPYLHFGQISPLYLLRKALKAADAFPEAREAFIEQLLVRRELAVNFAFYKQDYDRYSAIPLWARVTLNDHLKDPRPFLYNMQELEAADTHDPYWNAAMKEMVHTGFMHNYMRMYWAKKILEWSASPEEAHATTLFLNNRYFLDGRDPNSYTGVAWCYGLHDRPWKERPIFGKVRYMAASGLERKCDIKAYVENIDSIIRHGESQP